MSLARFSSISAAALAIVLLPAAAHAAPSAKDKAAARALVATAKKASKAHRYDDAVTALKKADKLDPSPATELDLGQALIASGKLVEARRVLRPVAEGPAAARTTKSAKKALADLEPRIPTVRLEVVGPAKSTAGGTLDGMDLDVAREVPANPGDHTVGATADGYIGAERGVVLAEGAHEVVKLRLAAVPREPDPPPPPPAKKSGSRVPGVVTLSIGGAGLVAGGVLGALAFQATSAAKAQCAGDVCPPGAANDVARSKLYGNASTGLFIAGGAVAAAGIVLIVVAPGGSSGEKDEAKAVHVTPWIGAGQAGVSGTF
jgi:hypothetical protein